MKTTNENPKPKFLELISLIDRRQIMPEERRKYYLKMTDDEIAERRKAMMNYLVFAYLRKIDLVKIQQNKMTKINEDTTFGEDGANIPATIDDLLYYRNPSAPIKKFLVKLKKDLPMLLDAYVQQLNIEEAFIGEFITKISQQSESIYQEEETLIKLKEDITTETEKKSGLIDENAKYQKENDQIKTTNQSLILQRGQLSVANGEMKDATTKGLIELQGIKNQIADYHNLLNSQKVAYDKKINEGKETQKEQPKQAEAPKESKEEKPKEEAIPVNLPEQEVKPIEIPTINEPVNEKNEEEPKKSNTGKRNYEREKRMKELELQGLSKAEIAQREGISMSFAYAILERIHSEERKAKKEAKV